MTPGRMKLPAASRRAST